MNITPWPFALGLLSSALARPVLACEALASLALPATTVTLAQSVPPGSFVSDVEAPFFASTDVSTPARTSSSISPSAPSTR
jgi:hypothetical protein